MKDNAQSVEAQEWALRIEVAAACRLIALYGWDDQISTHVTARLPGSGSHFLINPFGLYFDEVTASSLQVLDETGHSREGGRVNVAGFMVHSAIHMNRQNAHAVVHLHTIAGMAVGASAPGLRNLSPYSMAIDPVAYHDWEGLVINDDERARLAADLGDSAAMLLRNHGSLTVGETMAQAFTRAYYLQRACEVQVAAGGLRGSLIEQSSTLSQLVQGQSSATFNDAYQLNWNALIRRLDRVDPGFRN